ncbi:MAG TPA: imidazolonepropionase [Candidatus Tripitaka californicus]|uniref:imidazolonepropionase n=1 Tax=Candidatus Tripitaka californicus TaxID=3367616 RepID=UPI0040298F52|nr:imidazolonepropionase [Planctomycetota bacterium]
MKKKTGKQCDLVVVNASELLTLADAPHMPRTGGEMRDLGLIRNGGLAIEGCEFVAVGPSREIESKYAGKAKRVIDASGKVVMPGFVDPHTHAVFAGWRDREWVMRLGGICNAELGIRNAEHRTPQSRGMDYLDVLKAGGGILETVSATRAASQEELMTITKKHLDTMLLHGTTTAEVKSGYGLDLENEIKILKVIEALGEGHPIRLIPTFLGAHAVPAEYKDDPEGYVEAVMGWLPEVKTLARFCDVFLEEGAFNLAQAERILVRAKGLGLALKLHAGEFKDLGGAGLALRLGATSVDHLDYVSEEDMVKMARRAKRVQRLKGSKVQGVTVAVLLPGVPFFLRRGSASGGASARVMIDLGVPVAIGTDFNPGTCPTPNMQLIMTLACLELGMTPEEVISAATINAAHALGYAHRVGSLEVGKRADVLILDVPTYTRLTYQFGVSHVETVIKTGKVVVGDL